jgi:hypothetical protein
MSIAAVPILRPCCGPKPDKRERRVCAPSRLFRIDRQRRHARQETRSLLCPDRRRPILSPAYDFVATLPYYSRRQARPEGSAAAAASAELPSTRCGASPIRGGCQRARSRKSPSRVWNGRSLLGGRLHTQPCCRKACGLQSKRKSLQQPQPSAWPDKNPGQKCPTSAFVSHLFTEIEDRFRPELYVPSPGLTHPRVIRNLGGWKTQGPHAAWRRRGSHAAEEGSIRG